MEGGGEEGRGGGEEGGDFVWILCNVALLLVDYRLGLPKFIDTGQDALK